MPISEERLQILLPRRLKEVLREHAKDQGTTIGAYVRRLIEADLAAAREKGTAPDFPFGEKPIHTGRTRGSIEHDRPD